MDASSTRERLERVFGKDRVASADLFWLIHVVNAHLAQMSEEGQISPDVDIRDVAIGLAVEIENYYKKEQSCT